MAPRLLAQGALVAILALPALREGIPCLYDGSGNNDNQQFATDALWISEHGYLQIPTHEPGHAQYSLALTVTGWAPHSGRICAQGMAALVATLLKTDPVWTYSSFFAALSVFWSFSVGFLARTLAGRESLPPLALLAMDILAILFPSSFFFIANGNLANGYATVLACFGLFLFRNLQLGGIPSWYAILLLLTVLALVGTYPEMIAFLALIALVSSFAGAAVNPAEVRRARWWIPLGACVLSLVVFPPATCRLVSTIQTARIMMRLAHLDMVANSFNVFANLTPIGHLCTAPTMATQLGDKVPGLVHVALAVCILAALVASIRWGGDGPLATSVLAIYSVSLWMVFNAGYGYGWQKIHQYMAGPFAALLLAGIARLASVDHKSTRQTAGTIAAALLSIWLMAGFVSHVRILARISKEKSLSTEHIQIQRTLAKLVSGENPEPGPIVIHDQSFPTFWSAYFHSMWLNHFVAGLPVAYDDAGTGGGYLKSVSLKQSKLNAPPRLHVWGNTSIVRPGGRTLFEGVLFRLVQDPEIQSIEGLIREEILLANGKWVAQPGNIQPGQIRAAVMNPELVVNIQAPQGGFLEIEAFPIPHRGQSKHPTTPELVCGDLSVDLSGPGSKTLRIPISETDTSVKVLGRGSPTSEKQPFCRISRIEFIP